jgi:hypothetical protein
LVAYCLNDACRHVALIDVSSYPTDTEVPVTKREPDRQLMSNGGHDNEDEFGIGSGATDGNASSCYRCEAMQARDDVANMLPAMHR